MDADMRDVVNDRYTSFESLPIDQRTELKKTIKSVIAETLSNLQLTSDQQNELRNELKFHVYREVNEELVLKQNGGLPDKAEIKRMILNSKHPELQELKEQAALSNEMQMLPSAERKDSERAPPPQQPAPQSAVVQPLVYSQIAAPPQSPEVVPASEYKISNTAFTVIKTKTTFEETHLNPVVVGIGAYKIAIKTDVEKTKNDKETQVATKIMKSKALLLVRPQYLSAKDIADAQNELEVHRQLKEVKREDPDALPNVAVGHLVDVQGLEVRGQSYSKGILTSFGNRGTLDKYKAPNLGIQYQIAKEMALGVEQLHKLDILHRDIKADNFIVNEDEKGHVTVKLIDLAKCTPANHPTDTVIFPPLLSHEMGFSKEADAYQLGVALWQEFCNIPTYSIVEGKVVTLDHYMPKEDPRDFERWEGMADLSPDVAKLIKSLLSNDPTKRPTAGEVAHFFGDLERAEKMHTK